MPTGLFIINQNAQTSWQLVLLPLFLLITEKLVLIVNYAMEGNGYLIIVVRNLAYWLMPEGVNIVMTKDSVYVPDSADKILTEYQAKK